MTVAPFFKVEPIRSRAYLDYLKTQPCIVSHRMPTEPAHLRLLGKGGTGTKPQDCYALPLHWELHRRQSTEGELAVWLSCVNDKPDFLARLLIEVAEARFAKWNRS